MIILKVIHQFLLLLWLLNGTLSQDMRYPDSNEDSSPYQNIPDKWQIKLPGGSSGASKSRTKTFSVSSRMFPVHDENGLSGGSSAFNFGGIGSGSSANAGSFGFGGSNPYGGYMSGSGSSANAGSLSYGGGLSGSGSSAQSGSMNFGSGYPGIYGGGSGSSAQSGSLSYGSGNPGTYGSGSGSSSSANSGSMSLFQPGFFNSLGGSGANANSASLSYGGGGNSGMLSGSSANAGSSSFNAAPSGSGGGSGSFASSGSSSFSFARCTGKPKQVGNSRLSCSSTACQTTCLEGYKFPTGETIMSHVCNNGQWMVKHLELNEVPECEPVCNPKCLNNGICVSPGECECPNNFMGTLCEAEKKLCNPAPMAKNVKRSCTPSKCTFTCMSGFKYPDATLSKNLICKDGEWKPENPSLLTLPNCEPICEPKCQNGGNCISYNMCQCPHNFRGSQCQYGVERCSPKKLNFNGGYNCTGSSNHLTCKLYCPERAVFTFQPSPSYTCNYTEGVFIPTSVPKCSFANGEVIQLQESESMEFGQMSNESSIKGQGKLKGTQQDLEEVIVETVKTVKKKKENEFVDEDEFFESANVNQLYKISQGASVIDLTPKPSVCITWNGNKIKTFDGVTYNHELICSHVLVQDFIDGTFNVILRSCPYDSIQPCPHALEVFLQNEQFTFESVGGGQVKLFTTKKEIPIPVQIASLKVTRSGMDVRIVLEAIPLTITWDTKKFVQIDATVSVFNKTAGLCGTMDGILNNDFMSKDRLYHKMPATFVDSWRTSNMDVNKEKCIPRSQSYTTVGGKKCETAVEEKANLVCVDLLKNPRMNNCFAMFNREVLMKNCISDYCECTNTYERTECICNGIAALAKDCHFRGIMLDDGWRDWQICPLNCTNGRIYKSCGPLNEPSCGSAIEDDSFSCREGCFCPEGTMLSDGVCVKKSMCPCKLKGKSLPPKHEITRDCNTCTCENGNWNCSMLTCGARCGSVGDPHYMTFDGKRYDFMGKCSYYLMKTDSIIVEAENVACSGAISENMNFLPSFSSELPSCTKSLTIRFNDDAGQQRIIKLKQGRFVLLDGFEVAKLPKEISNGAVLIRQASSQFVVVDFQDGAKVWWDGSTRAYIDAPASYRGKTRGLCGTFNSNMQDDFLTPEDDVEETVPQFANKWQTNEFCEHLTNTVAPHQCQINVEKKAIAEVICSKLLNNRVFQDCHLSVDPEPSYEDCMYDVCACKSADASDCACPILASYASECSRQGAILNWRYQVAECAVNCPDGQVWEQCGEACIRTCSDLQTTLPCKLQCVEGCRCPIGQVLDEESNECVLTSMCKCLYKGMEFRPGYKEVRPGNRYLELCTCAGGRWSCVEALNGDSIKYPPAIDMTKKCSPANNEVFTTCEPAEPVTCKNMHMKVGSSSAICRPGCMCKEGYVLDVMLKTCVLPEKCSCHHGGKSYNEGEKIKADCNTCECKGAKWQCTTSECAGTCSLWGDNHFTTFDGRDFDFQGVCSYMLSKGKFDDGNGYSISIQNVLCGSNGVTCSKTLVINLIGYEAESITLSSDSVASPGIKTFNEKPLKKILTYRSGIFLVVEIPHIGVLLKWDRGTRVYLRLENRWKGKVGGLCGNYNYDALDDFLNPSLGIENNPIIFGHSWKLDDSCARPTEQVDSCTLNPQRKTWAQRKCGLLKLDNFASCHSEVSVESFYKRCVHDACSCDQGGDCECLCTALAAYAQECTAKGVNIRWRTPDLCPMQCDPKCSNYEPCISFCPTETCDNMMHPLKHELLCKSEMCVEGCKLKDCPDGTVYSNDSYVACVPKATCKPLCLQENGISYYEGDIMSSDACHVCKCTRGSKICTGVPCIDAPGESGDLFVCETGWTSWINQDAIDSPMSSASMNYFKQNDIEPLPSALQFKNIGGRIQCKPEFYAAIECRTVVDHQKPKETKQDVECSLERGLFCKGQCFDYEIRIYCDCGDVTKAILAPIPTIPTTATIPTVPFIPVTTPKYNTAQHCDPAIPNVEHPKSCSMYLQCERGIDGVYTYVEKNCGPGTMYQPKTMICDHALNVIVIKPLCGKPPDEWQGDKCPPGYEFSACAIPCKRSCHYYEKVLLLNGNCTMSSNECQSGCLPLGAATECSYPKMWRDHLTCVNVQDCTCMGPNNEQLKPGQKIVTEDCKTCQCVGNEFICVESACQLKGTPPPNIIITPKVTSWIVFPTTTVKSVQILEPPPPYIQPCDPSNPMQEHPKSCYKYLQCEKNGFGNFVLGEKNCYPDKMYNPLLKSCDSFENVKQIKPLCASDPGEVDFWEEIVKNVTRPSITTTTSQLLLVTKPPEIPSYITLCDVMIEYKEHPNSCYKFLHCSPASNGSYIYVVKTCYPNMMYNPTSKNCDWPASVEAIKPICKINPGEIEIWEYKSTSIPAQTTTTPQIFLPGPTQPVLIPPYYIRACDPSTPKVEHPDDCHKYLECLPTINGSFIYTEKSCGISLMFHPQLKTCDAIHEVKLVKAICSSSVPIFPPIENLLTERPPGVVTTRPPKKISPATKVTTPLPLITKSTVTPPLYCDQSKLVPFLHLLPDSAFSASSFLSKSFKPELARIDNRPSLGNSGSWAPLENNLNQYLQITFPQAIPIYGVIVRGSPLLSQYVTSYKVLYNNNDDDIFYHVIEDENGNPQIFSGSVSQNEAVKNIFNTPVEAKVVRIYPLSWEGSISLRAEILGCQRDPSKPVIIVPPPFGITPPIIIPLTTPSPTTPVPLGFVTTPSMVVITTIKPLCDDPMGVENSRLNSNQIKFSSIKDLGSVKNKVRKNALDIIKLSSKRGWIPIVNSLNEYIMFDFLENRNITGIISKGGDYGWVKSFTVAYSKDNVIWSNLWDHVSGKPKQFLANYDSENVKKNYFATPINARYLKIQPSKWSSAIELKVEPIGCYLPYPIDFSFSTIPDDYDIITPSHCLMCKGALPPNFLGSNKVCVCQPPLYWSGTECVPQSECPCIEGHQSFPVGETYRTENCDECVCQIGGVPKCTPKVCKPCPKGTRLVSPNSCVCKCEKCPTDMVLCQTNGQCIPETSWCDDVEDCPDDEINCVSTDVPSLNVTRVEEIIITKKCPEPKCPPRFKMKPKSRRKSKMDSRFNNDDDDDDDKPTVNSYYYIKAKYTASYEAILPISKTGDREDINNEECLEFVCIPIAPDSSESPDYLEGPLKCPEPKCPSGYMTRLHQLIKNANECAKFSCEPIQENDVVCNVTGRTFNTFDSTEFKYDICSHLLARDITDEKWNVIMRKNCSAENSVCTKELEIKDKKSLYTLILYPNLTVKLDGYTYTVQQLQNSNRKMAFAVSKNGDSLYFFSQTHGLWINFDQYGDVKLGISSQYANNVDGLCGFFNNDKNDDKRTPDGKIAPSTVEFGNSWSVNQVNPEDCEPSVCPRQLQDAAWKMCNLVKDDIFSSCAVAANPLQFITTCLETACECLLTATNGNLTDSRDFEKHTKSCKCTMLKNYVQECMAADENIHLETWRSVFSCEASCPPSFVHHDCYRRQCEITCNNLQTADCPNVPGTCFTGCFCPPGTVKKESTCVPISECRDCVCDGFGKSQYLTFDRKNFTFDGNCTYLLTRDITLRDVHTFQVYATIGACENKTIPFRQPTCTQALHIVYGTHIVHIQKNPSKNLEVIVDGFKLPSLSYNQNWMKIEQQGKSLNILLPESQVELTTMFEAMSFSIKVPSVKYGNKMEGICGNCNGNPDDDLIRNPKLNTSLPLTNTEMQNFALSWLADEPKLSLNENKETCYVYEETDCLPLPPETDPCFKILDDDVFAKCHIIVDPISYVTACQQDLCRTGSTQKGSCESIAAYARECSRSGVCIDWRRSSFCPMECAAPFVYNPCGCGETCQSVEEKEKQIKLSTAIKDARTIDKMKSICKEGLSEGCFCPNGTVLHNNKCLREIECRACDDKGHLPGDVWHPDVCTKCTCGNDSTIQCQKIQCPTQQTICGIGFKAIESSPTGECCKKYACVPELKTTTQCPQLVLPKCGVDQTNKIIDDTSGCSKYICDCVPKDQCKPMQNFTNLEPGVKTVIDNTGCCPVSKLVCDKSKCPPKPPQCTEAFYVMEKTKSADDKICCDAYECQSPPNNCIATINGKKILKKMDETWMTEDVCVKAQCAFDTNGNPVIKTQREVCNVICQAGFEYKSITNKCCGECVKTKCIADNKLYEIGEVWSSADNCSTFECYIKEGQTLITSSKPTCPEVSSCAPENRYSDGCCEKCKLESLSQKNCVAEPIIASQTVGLIQEQMPLHGNCKNLEIVRGLTQCSGSCKSGTKFDTITLQQVKECDCCSVKEMREVPVELVCDDGYKYIKNLNVPADCACSACENGADSILKFARASF